MARILGVDLPRNKAMKIAMRALYGVGPKSQKKYWKKSASRPKEIPMN